ncbi:uncharacterized protein LOC106068402 isoform X1 [Biomphalaria glabrata]|uniref:Uncharacterized protein LOC106068402 isoform X1 n=1 Tax=Biomphalaria glabrata TaxID=6526 RepID=A0A9W2YG57_BIOGL|nr:uncharacterized protein LOC106068402 isoform X1 [Biomphalaria glabrata]
MSNVYKGIFICLILIGFIDSSGSSNTVLGNNTSSSQSSTNNNAQKIPDPAIQFNPFLFANTLMTQMIPMFSPFLYPSSPKCAEHRGRVFEGIIQQKIWAMKFVDSFGKLGSGIFQGNTIIMGNYDLCLSADDGNGTSGSFIELKFLAPVPVTTLITSGFANQQNGLPFLYWHICLPTQCNKADAESIGTKFADESGITLVETLIHESKSPTEDTCFIIAVIILSVLGAFCLAGTVIDVFTKDEEEEVARGEDVTVGASGLNAEQEPQSHNESVIVTGIRVIPGNQNEALTPPTVGQHVLPRRTSEILKTEKSNNVSGQPADVTVDAVDANSDISNGSTFIDRSSLTSRRSSLTWRRSNELGVLGRSLLAFSLPTNLRDILNAKHSPGDITCLHGIRVLTISWVILGHCYYQAPYYINQTTLLDMSRWWTFQGILNAPFAVDTFFMLSGCLVAFLFLRTTQKAGKLTVQNMVLYYVHRFLRLTPMYALIILCYTGIAPYMESGPFVKVNSDRDVSCRKTWWRNIVYISNFISDDGMCMVWSWYLANDMQFYVVAPLALVPIALGYLYPGVVVALLMLACHIVSYAVIDDKYHAAALYRNAGDYMAKLYLKPWSRVGPYAVGLLLGVILYKRQKNQKINKNVATLGWLLATGGGLTLMYATYDNFRDGGFIAPAWGEMSTIAHETLKSPVWGMCVGWVVFACFSNCGGFIDSFLSWQGWIPLSKLTFGAYLVHLIIMMFFNNNAQVLNYFSYFFVIERFLAVFVLSYGLSLVFSLLIETPVRNLIKPPGKKKHVKAAKPGSTKRDIDPDLEVRGINPEEQVIQTSGRKPENDVTDGRFYKTKMYLPHFEHHQNRAYVPDENEYESADNIGQPQKLVSRWK